MKKINVSYNAITGFQYNMVEIPSIRIETPFAVPQTRKATKTGLKRIITTQNKIIPETETNETTLTLVVIEQSSDGKTSLVQTNPCLDAVRKRCDKKRTIAISNARRAKQTRQTFNIPETNEIDIEPKNIKKSPIVLTAKAYQHIVTSSCNEICIICGIQR